MKYTEYLTLVSCHHCGWTGIAHDLVKVSVGTNISRDNSGITHEQACPTCFSYDAIETNEDSPKALSFITQINVQSRKHIENCLKSIAAIYTIADSGMQSMSEIMEVIW